MLLQESGWTIILCEPVPWAIDDIVLLKCNTKYGSNMEDYQVRCTVAAMLYVGGQVKSYEEAMKIADSMLNASKQYQG